MTPLLLAVVLASGCAWPATPAPAPTPAPPTVAAVPLRAPLTQRVVVFGDVHGDLDATRTALRLGGLVDAADHWAGGDAVGVQLGDILDRGDDERAILDLFARLQGEAAAAGGAFHVVLGNHELMNVAGDWRYVTPGGLAAFADVPYDPSDPELAHVRPELRGRLAAFSPGGPYALRLAGWPLILVLGDVAYVHGGLLAAHAARGVDTYNAEVAAWLRATAPMPAWVMAEDSPAWTRLWSRGVPDCAALGPVLAALGVRRMVVAHSPQPDGINGACDGRVWRVDVGMARAYGGTPAVLELQGDRATVHSKATSTDPVRSPAR